MQAMRELNGVGPWRGNPGLLLPIRQWWRENIPSSIPGPDGYGFTLAGDDGFARIYSKQNGTGVVCPLEVKENGRPIDVPTLKSWDALKNGAMGDPLFLQFSGGNLPSELWHYPVMHPGVGLPPVPVVAKTVKLNDKVVAGADLREIIIAHLHHNLQRNA